MSYGNSFSDNYSWYNTGTCYTHHSYTNRTVTYDGYGTLVIKKNSYKNIARLKIIENTIDTALCPPNKVILNIADSSYLWFDPVTNQPIMHWKFTQDTATRKIIQSYLYSHLPALTSDVQSLSNEESIGLFPNPTNGKCEIKMVNGNPLTIEVYNMFGKKVHEMNNWKNSSTIDLSLLTSGIYFLQIKTTNGNSTKKIVLQK